MSSNKFYLTTTLPYVNADPHLGFALELVQADIIARYRRLLGDEVFFNTGTDEHGQKIFDAAQKSGRRVEEYANHFAAEFRKLKEALDLSNDAFIRTTDPKHIKAAQELWQRCQTAGDIELREYSGLYCVGCEAFKTKRELTEDGHCLLHPNIELTKLEEKNYFFKFSKYQDKLLDYLSRPDSVIPEWKRQEAINFVKDGLEDFSISRGKSKLIWGIPVPEDSSQVMYVWFDALTNYISTLDWPSGENFKKFWVEGQTIQIAGKDQVRFQSLMWQAMLMSAGIKNTDSVVYHGFINSGGQKMSKSLGNVINPFDLVNEYGTDAVRYFLARHVTPFEDSDVTLERFKEAYNANLANGLGNLVSRVMKMANTNSVRIEANLPAGEAGDTNSFLEKFEIQKAADLIWQKIGDADLLIQQKEPFKLIKTNRDEAIKTIEDLCLRLYTIGEMLAPIMPATSATIKQLVRENKMPDKPLFARKD